MRIPTFAQFERQAALISKEFNDLAKLHEQISSGNKLLHSSDDPSLANQINSKQDLLNQLENYLDNGILAQTRNSLVSTSISSASNILGQVQVLIKKVQDGVMTDTDRLAVSKQLQGYLSNLLSIANTQDANGQHIFAGGNTNAPGYVLNNGSYQYQGSDNTTSINIAPSISTVYNDSGYSIFGNIYTGNGTFTVAAGTSNTGSASSSPGNVVNPSAYVADTYTVSFLTNTAGKLVYQVTGATSGQVIPAPPTSPTADNSPVYTSGADIKFNGISFSITGGPVVGDTFTVQPSTKQNIFNSMQNLVNLLANPVTNKAQYNQSITQADATFVQIINHISTYQSTAGTRSITVDDQLKSNQEFKTNLQATIKSLSLIDLPQVSSALAQQTLVLQATQESYLKIQEILSRLLQM